MANRYAEDIRRIVGLKDTKGGLGPATERDPVKGGRGVGYYDPKGNVTSQSGGKNNVGGGAGIPGSASTDGRGTFGGSGQGGSGSQTQDSLSGGDNLSPFDPNDPFSLLTPQDSGKYDIADLADGRAGPGLNTLDRMSVLSGCDPGSGNEVQILSSGLEYVPPDGWEDAETPPNSVDETWTSGYYYTSSFGVCGSTQTAGDQKDCILAIYEASPTYDEAVFLEYDPAITPGDTTTGLISTMRFELTLAGSGSKIIVGQGLSRNACTGGDPSGPGDYCSTEPPLTGPPLDSWPSDDIIAIKPDVGAFNTSDFENSADLSGFNQGGNSTLNLESCDPTHSGRYFQVKQTADGGTVVYETDSGGAPLTDAIFRKYSPTGELVGAGDITALQAYFVPSSTNAGD